MSVFMRLHKWSSWKWRWKWKTDHIDTTKIDLSIVMDTNKVNIKSLSIWWYFYVLSNTQATSEAQFMKKLSNTEAEFKKIVAYKKSV